MVKYMLKGISQLQTWVWLFYPIQLGLRKFWFDSTYYNGFAGLDSNQLTTQNGFLKFKIDSRLKKLQESLFKSTHDLKNFSESWFESTHDSMMIFIPSFVWALWAFNSTVDLVRPFLDFPLKVWLHMILFGLSTQVLSRQIDSNQLMTQAVSWRL